MILNSPTLAMKQLIKTLLLSLSLLLVLSLPAYSQFEGEIQFQGEDFTDPQSGQLGFTLTSAIDRILISSDHNVNVITGLNANGLLIRNDLQDFVFYTDTDQALKVSKDDLDGLMNMIDRFGGSAANGEPEPFDWESGVEETGNTKSHLGYTVHEFRLQGENARQFVSIWLTEDIKMRWGLMVDVWDRVGTKFSESELPIELIMNPNSFPLLVEVFDGGNLVFKIESTSVNTTGFDRSAVELSDDKALLGLTELMMNMFRQRR